MIHDADFQKFLCSFGIMIIATMFLSEKSSRTQGVGMTNVCYSRRSMTIALQATPRNEESYFKVFFKGKTHH